MSRTAPTIAAWLARIGGDPRRIPEAVAPLLDALRGDDPAWILRCDEAAIRLQVERLLARGDAAGLPLLGVPFAVKDNIDVAGLPTTAACPAWARTAERDATVVARLQQAGAILVGKTNLDQFATGLVGTRSPYGVVPNAFDASRISGGSSSGSASVVARGLAAFALGTDTAGSGRVPAGFNNLVGLKPTPGRVGMAGVVPACRTLDTVSVFALTCADAARVLAIIEGPDDAPAFQHWPPRAGWLPAAARIGVPRAAQASRTPGYDAAFDDAIAQCRALGAQVEAIDFDVLDEVARLLYEGPWVAERYTVVAELLARDPSAFDATVRSVIEQARRYDAADAFRAAYRLAQLKGSAERLWERFDLLMVPTAPWLPEIDEVAEDPVGVNSQMGRYTNFVNLLGMAALAMPSGFTATGLPFGVTFIAPGGSDAALCAFGATWESARALPLGAGLGRAGPAAAARGTGDAPQGPSPGAAPTVRLAVVGAHLQGQPLHGQLVERGCRLLARTRTAPRYRLYALPGSQPPKPGLFRCAADDPAGEAIEVELYEMPTAAFGSFVAAVPPPLAIGSVELADPSWGWVKGFVCEAVALQGAEEITAHGGWVAYLASRAGAGRGG